MAHAGAVVRPAGAGTAHASGVEIARALGLSTKTVDTYKRRVQDKLGLAHRTHYVRFALEAGVFGERNPASPAAKR